MAVDERLERFMRTNALLENDTLVALIAVSGLALFARLAFLGTRVAHWDEARVGYWILRYMETGDWTYRPIIHGPFLQQINPGIFALIGVSDFSARFVVALLGGLLPLSAWLFREHLRDSEMLALGILFALDPFLLYYSRFMRSDLPLAAFMIFALGFYVRAVDTKDTGYFYIGTGMLALAFTTKESVLVYLLCWIGAGALLLDHRLFRGQRWRSRGPRPRDEVERRVKNRTEETGATDTTRWVLAALIALVEFFVIVVYFYAPRPELWQAFTNPAMFPGVIGDATVGSWNAFTGQWVDGAVESDHAYLDYATHFWDTLVAGAGALFLFAIVGFIADRYSGEGPRDLVSFTSYWGFAMLLGYPLVTDIKAPWGPIHVVAPLAIPAAVGFALLYRWGRAALSENDRLTGTLVLTILVLVGAQMGATAVSTTYLNPQNADNDLAQWGQPAPGIRPTLESMGAASQSHEGIDVAYFGYVEDGSYTFYVPNETDNDAPPAASGWYNRLPLPWYTEMYGAEVDSTDSTDELMQWVESDRPPVIIARQTNRTELERQLPSRYVAYEHGLTLWGSETIFFVDRSQLPDEAELAQERAYHVPKERTLMHRHP